MAHNNKVGQNREILKRLIDVVHFLESKSSRFEDTMNVIFGILQNKDFDMQFCLSSIGDFCSITEKEKAKFESIYVDTA